MLLPLLTILALRIHLFLPLRTTRSGYPPAPVWAWFGTPLGLLPQTDVLANPVQLWARLVSQAFLAVILPAHLPHPFGAHLASEAIIHGHLFPHGFCLGHSAAPSFFIHFVLGGAGIIADLILG